MDKVHLLQVSEEKRCSSVLWLEHKQLMCHMTECHWLVGFLMM